MMGKAPNRKKPRTNGALRDRIAEEAAAIRAAHGTCTKASDSPELRALLDSAREALLSACPTSFAHKGETYFLRVSVGLARLMVFDGAADGEPLVVGLTGSLEERGHQPLH